MALGGSSPTDGYVRALIEDDPAELYETAPCGYLSTDPSGTIVKANRTFLDWTGYQAADLVHERRFQSLLAVGDRIFYETHFAPSLAMQGAVREIAVEVVCASGERMPALVNAVRTDGTDGRPVSIRIAVFDARERRSYERELLAARARAEHAAAEARALAETLQRTLLPLSPPDIPGIDVGTAYRAAGDGSVVGGDFYDLFELKDDTWGVTLGDVCGKGAPAAIVTALARHTIRALGVRAATPSEVLRGLHDAIARSDIDSFCTALYLTVRAEDGSLQVCVSAGGHHLPLLVDSTGRSTEVGRAGHMLGMLEPLQLHDEDVVVAPGEALVLYTDGVLEAARDGAFFGEERLHEVIADNCDGTAQELADAIAGAAVAFQRDHTRDDIAVLVLGAAASR